MAEIQDDIYYHLIITCGSLLLFCLYDEVIPLFMQRHLYLN